LFDRSVGYEPVNVNCLVFNALMISRTVDEVVASPYMARLNVNFLDLE